MRSTLRVGSPRRFRAVPARTSMTYRLPDRSCLRSLAERILTLTFVPPLTCLKVENSALLAVVRTRRRTSVAPVGTATDTGTPDDATVPAATVAGETTRAAANVVPASGTAAASAVVGAAERAASVWAGGASP